MMFKVYCFRLKRALLIIALVLPIISCKTKNNIPESLKDVKRTVAFLDSAVTSMYGWEPQDSTYNKSVDTLVSGILNQYKEGEPEFVPIEASEPVIKQSSYDSSKLTWTAFKKLIDADQYEKALDFYFADKEGEEGKNSNDFLLFLKHSSCRYRFDSDVLFPLMREFKGDAFAVKHYIDILHLEKAMEDASIAMNQREEPYIPEAYPYVLNDLGFALASSGKINEALNLSGDFISAVYNATGSSLYANFCGTKYGARLYVAIDDPESAIGLWEEFERYLDENKDDYEPEELESIKRRIVKEKKEISELK